MTLAICQVAGFRIVRKDPGKKPRLELIKWLGNYEVPDSLRKNSELSSHQMALGGVVAHSSSWTLAASEPHEVFLRRLFRLHHFGRRFRCTHPPVPCEVDPKLYGSAGSRS